MSVDEFWWGDNSLVKIYKRAYVVSLRRQNQMMHRQGAYIYEALCDASPLFRDLLKGNVKPHDYSVRPYPMDEDEIEERKQEEARERYERIRSNMIQSMLANNRKVKANE